MAKLTENLTDLTFIIPSYNRQAYLLRNLQYWGGKGPQVFALDGSEIGIPEKITNDLGANIHYYHWPISYRERLAKVRDLIQTKYVAQLADDDFYLPSAILESIQALDADISLVACIGRPLGFNYCKNDGVIGIMGVYQDMFNDYVIDSDNPSSRMLAHMGRYMPSTIDAVLRADSWKKSIELYAKYEFPVFAIGELQIELSISYLGKSKVIPCLSWLKSTELEQVISPDISLIRACEFHDCWDLPEFKNEFRDRFLQVSSEVFSEFDGRDPLVIANEVEVAMDAYVAWCDSYFRKMISFYGIRENLKRVLPDSITNVIKSHLRAHRLKRNARQPKQSLLELGQHLNESGTFVNMAELQEIVNFIQSFHLKQDTARGLD